MKRALQCWSIFAVVAAEPVLAGDSAKGEFRSGEVRLPVADAYAHLGKGQLGDDSVIHVHLSGRPIDHAAIDAALDRDAAFAEQFSENAPSVTLHFGRTNGKWYGTSYAIAPATAAPTAVRRMCAMAS